jgi:hypothetical protein
MLGMEGCPSWARTDSHARGTHGEAWPTLVADPSSPSVRVCPFVSVWHTVRACDRDGNAVIGLLYCYFWSPGQRSTMAFVTVSCHPRLITAGKSESVAKNHRSHRPDTCRLHAALLSSGPARPRWLCPLGHQRNHTQSLIKMTQISRENGERHGALNPKPSWLEPAAS